MAGLSADSTNSATRIRPLRGPRRGSEGAADSGARDLSYSHGRRVASSGRRELAGRRTVGRTPRTRPGTGSPLGQGRGEGSAQGGHHVLVAGDPGLERKRETVFRLVLVARDDVQVEVEHALPRVFAAAIEQVDAIDVPRVVHRAGDAL